LVIVVDVVVSVVLVVERVPREDCESVMLQSIICPHVFSLALLWRGGERPRMV
jgi:hypothetical protein